MREEKSLDIIISENLQFYRNQAHLTQAELAENLNISISHIANIERKESSVSLALIKKILDFFQITPNDLMLDKTKIENLSKDQQIKAIISEKLDGLKIDLYSELHNHLSEESTVIYSTPIRPRQKKQSIASSKKLNKSYWQTNYIYVNLNAH